MNSVLRKFDMKGRSALVTGGASGLGLAYAEALAEAGACVTLTGRDLKNVEREATRLRGQGWDVRPFKADVAQPEEVAAAFDAHITVFGGLDAAFANAGLDAGAGFWNPATHSRNPQGQIDTFDHATWRKSMSVNLDGVFFTVAEAARVMKSGGRPGSIIVTSSIASSKVFPPIATPYMAAKAAVTQLVKQVALELAEYRIRVNAIAPGMFVTNIGGGYLQNPAVREAWGKIVPLGKMAEPEQIKPLALFLASDASDFVTGTEMVIDGGVLLGNFG